MNKILVALVSMLMILGTIAPALAATSTATVSQSPTTFVLTAEYTTATTFSTDGLFTATLVATDLNGEEDITGSYTISWDDEDGTEHSETLTEDPIDDGNPLTRTYTATGAIPYHQDYLSQIAITSQGETAIVIINNDLVGISATDVAFGEVGPGGSSTASSTITNTGNVDVDVWATPEDLTSATKSDTIPAPSVDTTNPLTVENLVIGTGTGTYGFTLTVPEGTLASEDYTGTISFDIAVVEV